MDLRDNLIKYMKYSKGDLSKKCSLEYEDIDITGFNFSNFDLNNSFFGGVHFNKCDFSNVYLSGSNFGGSFLKECILKENIIKKAAWDDMVFENTEILLMNAFRTTFMYGRFQESNFSQCQIERCSLSNSDFKNVYFRECTIIDTDFMECKLNNVHFVKCRLENVKFDENVDKQGLFID